MDQALLIDAYGSGAFVQTRRDGASPRSGPGQPAVGAPIRGTGHLEALTGTKSAALQLWMIEHPVAGTMTAGLAPSYDPKRAYDVMPGNSVNINGGVHINVQGGATGADTIQNIKDSIGSWFKQAVDAAGSIDSGAVRRQLGGAYGT